MSRIRRNRSLPIKGSVFVRGGQPVTANQVIAEAKLDAQYMTIDLARGLSVSSAEVQGLLMRETGHLVDKGSLIARGRGISPREVRAPEAGTLVAISGGQALLEISSQPFQLRAGIPGVIAEVQADLGCIIEMTGAWVQGVWGNGHIGSGRLIIYGEKPNGRLNAKDFAPDERGRVVLAGICDDRKALEAGARNEINGLIVGSMSTRIRPIASRMPYPVIVLDGFGEIPMNRAAFDLLSTSAERDTSVNAEPYDPIKGTRPEVFLPLQGGAGPIPLDLETFKVGQRVRVVKAPHIGEMARITGLPERMVRFPSGLRAPGAQLELPNGDTTLVPLANIEVIG
jgi:hypothetical protein